MLKFKLNETIINVQWSFISLAAASLSHLLLRVLLGRELGPSGLGTYTLVFTIYLFGMQFSGFGIGSALTKYVAEFRDEINKVNEYISSGLASSLISGFIMAIILYLVSDFISINIFGIQEMRELLRIISFCLPFIAIEKMVLGTLNGLHKMKNYAIINIAQNVFILLLSVYLVLFLKCNLKGAVLGFVVPTIIISLSSMMFIKNSIVYPSLSLKSPLLRDLVWYGFYFVLANSIGMINSQIDGLMVGYFMDPVSVGFYSVANIIINGITLIPQSINMAVAPSIAYYYGKFNYNKITKLIQKTMACVSVAIIFLSILIIFLGKTFITILFNSDFLFAYSPLVVLLIGYGIYSPVHAVDCTLLSIGKVNLIYKISLACAIFNIVFNTLLIPKYGIVGAAFSTTMSMFILSIIKLYFIKKYVFDLDVSDNTTT